MSNNAGSKRAFAIITTLFFLWGFITVLVDSLIPRLKDVFELSYFQAGLVQFAFFLAYFIFSIPAGSILARIGYKKGIILGLLTMAFGCLLFYPASEYRERRFCLPTPVVDRWQRHERYRPPLALLFYRLF